jgi:hypothetical protein
LNCHYCELLCPEFAIYSVAADLTTEEHGGSLKSKKKTIE